MEKQTMNAIKSIYKFNQECKRPDGSCLLESGYSDERECAFPIEEALEGILTEDIQWLAPSVTGLTPKEFSRYLMNTLAEVAELPLADVDRLDKHLDIIIFSFGSIFKLGLTPQQAIRALSIVCDANLQKLSAGQDEHGKQKKPADFIPPEERLQKILDERQ